MTAPRFMHLRGEGSPAGTGSSPPGRRAGPRGGARRRGRGDSGAPGPSAPGAAAPPGRGCPAAAAGWTLDRAAGRHRTATRASGLLSAGSSPRPPGQGSPVHPLASGESQEQRPLPASVRVLNQSSNFSKQVSSATGCLGSARAAQRAGRSCEHSGSMTRPGVLQRKCQGRPAPALVASSPPTPAQGPGLPQSGRTTTITALG